MNGKILLLAALLFFVASRSCEQVMARSTERDAARFLDSLGSLEKSIYWPNIIPGQYLENVLLNIAHPLRLYEGVSTNFCSYAAVGYLFLHFDPLGYAKLMVNLYKYGKAKNLKVLLKPSAEIQAAAGTLKFKGVLDIRPADQLLFLCLAGHFKGFINLFTGRYMPGDEDWLWAVNFVKFNRMVRKLIGLECDAAGSDLIRPWINDMYSYIKKCRATGTAIPFTSEACLSLITSV